MKTFLHAPLYLTVALACAALVGLQPVDATMLDANAMVAVTDQVLSSLVLEAASDAPSRAE